MQQSTQSTAGVIGLGIIGGRVASRLRRAGWQLWVWNRTVRPEPNFLSSPAEVAESARHIQVFVSDGPALLEVMRSMAPALTPEHVVMNHATVSPSETKAAAEIARGKHAAFLDIPFTGSRDAAAQGQITYYIGGEAAALERAKPVLEASAKAIILLGGIGAASAVKIATNIMAAAAAVSLAEAICLLRKNGVDPAVLPSVLENNAARSGVTDLKLPCMLADDFAPRFSAKNMHKDMRLARQLLGQDEKTITATMEQLYGETCRQGSGDEDFAVVLKTLEV